MARSFALSRYNHRAVIITLKASSFQNGSQIFGCFGVGIFSIILFSRITINVIILKQLVASARISANSHRDEVEVTIRRYSRRLRRLIVKYYIYQRNLTLLGESHTVCIGIPIDFITFNLNLWNANTVTCLPMSIICIRDTIISSIHTFMSGPSMNILTYFPYIRSPLTNILRAYCDICSVFYIISRAFVDMYSARVTMCCQNFVICGSFSYMWFLSFFHFLLGITFTRVDCLWTLK